MEEPLLLVSHLTRVCIVSVYLQTVKHYSHCLQLNCWSMEEPLLVSRITRVCILNVPVSVQHYSHCLQCRKVAWKGHCWFHALLVVRRQINQSRHNSSLSLVGLFIIHPCHRCLVGLYFSTHQELYFYSFSPHNCQNCTFTLFSTQLSKLY